MNDQKRLDNIALIEIYGIEKAFAIIESIHSSAIKIFVHFITKAFLFSKINL